MSKLAPRILSYLFIFLSVVGVGYALGTEHPIQGAFDWISAFATGEFLTRRELATERSREIGE